MPSEVRTLRNLCATIDCPISLTKSCCRIPSTPHQRVDGIERGGAPRRQDAEHETACDRDRDGRSRRPCRRGEIEHGEQGLHEPDSAASEGDSDCGAEQRQARRSEEHTSELQSLAYLV